MHKHDVRRQTDNRIEKVRIAYRLHGMPFPEQHIDWLRSHVDSYAYGKFITNMATKALHTYTKENNMTPLQAATNKRDTLMAERAKNNSDAAEMGQACAVLAERNITVTTEILALSATIGAEERKEREAKHKAMAEELRAAGYRVEVDTVSVFGATLDTKAIIAAMTTACGAGPARQSRPTAPNKLGGVHGVGEGWYTPIVYDSQGVKLNHDFAISTRGHNEARNGWWLKHVPTGSITKGFPNEQEVHRWIRGRADPANGYNPQWSLLTWRTDQYRNTK